MANVHGSKLIITHNGSDISDYVKDDLEFGGGDRALIDTTGYGSTDTTHLVSPIKEGVPINLGGQWSTEVHAIIQPLDGETDATVIHPAGTGSGLPALTGNSTLTNYKVKSSVMGAATWAATLTPQDGFDWSSQ